MVDSYIKIDNATNKLLYDTRGMNELGLEIVSYGRNNKCLLSNDVVVEIQDCAYYDALVFTIKKDENGWYRVYNTKGRVKLNVKVLDDYVDEYFFNKKYGDE